MTKREALLKYIFPYKDNVSEEELNEYIFLSDMSLDDFIVELIERKVTNEGIFLKFFKFDEFKEFIKRWVVETPEGLIIKKSIKEVI